MIVLFVMKRVKLILLFLLVNLTLFAQDITRVISLASSITDNIYLVGGDDKLVGCTSYCIPAINDGKEQVGSAIEVNIEKVLALRPDIIFATKLTKQQDVATMKGLGLKVFVLNSPKNFNEICEQTQYISEVIGEQDLAEKVINDAKERVEKIRNKAQEMGRKKIFFQIGANPIFTVLENTYLNDLITICNAENIASGLKLGTMTRESVLLKNPDVIIIAEMGGFGKEEKKIWENYSTISAVKNNKIFIIPSETSCSPTPLNFAITLEEIYDYIANIANK